MARTDGPDKSNDHADGDRPASEGKQEKAIFTCGDCDTENPKILAIYRYTITYDKEQGKYVKRDDSVEYACGECLEELDIHDIEVVLKSVDEL